MTFSHVTISFVSRDEHRLLFEMRLALLLEVEKAIPEMEVSRRPTLSTSNRQDQDKPLDLSRNKPLNLSGKEKKDK